MSSPFIRIPLHPLFYALCFLVGGILIREYFPPSPLVLAIVSLIFIAGIGTTFLYAPLHLPYLLLYCGSLYGGYLSLSYHYWRHESRHPYLKESTTIDCVGIIQDWEPIEHPFMKYKIVCALQKIRHSSHDEWQQCSDTILIYTASLPAISIQDTVSINNLKIATKHDPSFTHYQLRHQYSATSFTATPTIAIIHHPVFSVARIIFYVRGSLFDTITKKLSVASKIFISSLFFGNKSIEHEKMQRHANNFKQWGVAHLFARSGLHLILFIALWHTLLRALPFSHLLSTLIATLIATLYFILSWPTASFVRSFLIFSGYKLSLFMRMPHHAFYLISLVCYLFLATNPILLFFLDFQLSFGITMIIVWFFAIQRHHRRHQ